MCAFRAKEVTKEVDGLVYVVIWVVSVLFDADECVLVFDLGFYGM